MPLIITLSAIPPRFAALGPTLRALLRQRHPADEIRLNIPERYRRFPEWDGTLPEVPEGVTIARCAQDYGPATKLLPTLQAYAGQPVDILLCDDDRIHDRNWTARFIAERARHPDCAIAEAGRFVPGYAAAAHPRRPLAVPRPRGLAYRLTRIATLGMVKPRPWLRSGYVDVFKGFGGALVRPEFFTPEVFDIPAHLWTVDDPWLSGQLERNGVGIWLNADGIVPGERGVARRDSLLKFEDCGQGRGDANSACFTWFQENFGIWRAR